MNIFNEIKLKMEIRRIVKEEMSKEYKKGQVESLWKHLNKLQERIKCFELQ